MRTQNIVKMKYQAELQMFVFGFRPKRDVERGERLTQP